MISRIPNVLIAVNAACIVLFAVLWFYAAWLAPMGSSGRVTSLDREQIIDIAKLEVFDPELASNVRYNLAEWIAEREREASVFNAICGLLVCLLNLFLLIVFGLGKRRQVA